MANIPFAHESAPTYFPCRSYARPWNNLSNALGHLWTSQSSIFSAVRPRHIWTYFSHIFYSGIPRRLLGRIHLWGGPKRPPHPLSKGPHSGHVCQYGRPRLGRSNLMTLGQDYPMGQKLGSGPDYFYSDLAILGRVSARGLPLDLFSFRQLLPKFHRSNLSVPKFRHVC